MLEYLSIIFSAILVFNKRNGHIRTNENEQCGKSHRHTRHCRRSSTQSGTHSEDKHKGGIALNDTVEYYTKRFHWLISLSSSIWLATVSTARFTASRKARELIVAPVMASISPPSALTMLQMVMQAYLPSLYATLGIFIPLIVVNCILLGRDIFFIIISSICTSTAITSIKAIVCM